MRSMGSSAAASSAVSSMTTGSSSLLRETGRGAVGVSARDDERDGDGRTLIKPRDERAVRRPTRGGGWRPRDAESLYRRAA